MNKRKSLKHIGAYLDSQYKSIVFNLLYNLVADEDRVGQIDFLGRVALYRDEISLHRRVIKKAITICDYGQNGAIPFEWEAAKEWHPHKELAQAINYIPNQALSAGLMKYIDLLPRMINEAESAMAERKDAFEILGENNPFAGKTEDEIGLQQLDVHLINIESTFFANSYADDLSQAKQLAESGGDFSSIRGLIS